MKKYGKILITCGVVCGIIFAVRCVRNPERRITNFVEANYAELQEIADAHLAFDTSVDTYQDVEVDGVFDGEHEIVQFFSEGEGIAPASKYYGFYYSPDDEPAIFQNGRGELSPTAEDEWEWTDGTDNGGKTVRIRECWYYYEAWF